MQSLGFAPSRLAARRNISGSGFPFFISSPATILNSFPILSDFNRVVIRAYDIVQDDLMGLKGYTSSKRAVFAISPEGFLRWKWISDNVMVEPPYGEVQHAVDDISRGQTES